MLTTLIENGAVYTPDFVGTQSILLLGDRIAKIGAIDAAQIEAVGLDCNVIDATGCVVVPGLIDPHAHTIGAGGEHGFTSRMPEIALSEMVNAGITTVVEQHGPCAQVADKGRLAVDHAADVLILHRDTLEIVHLFARGKQFIKHGRLVEPSQQEEQVVESKI